MAFLPDIFDNPFQTRVSNEDLKIELENKELWKEFSELTTEMIITKSGRRMFPHLSLKLSGLEMRSKYAVLFEIIPSDKYRYKFTNGGWKVMGKADIEPLRFPILHSDGVQTGEFWMSKDVVFKKLKLTNTTFSEPNHIFLSSMHKYHPRVHIIQYDRFDNPIHSTLRSFVFKYTDFIAVTAYQNEMITQKKIDCNPFAKGFRNKKEEGGRSHKRIFRSEEEDEEPAAKKQKTENESENRKLNPEQIMELMKQYQWVIQSSFGIVPIVEPLKKSPIKKKCGFGVMDLLADVR